MRNRNFMDAGIFEKANAFSTIKSKNLEEIKVEDFLTLLNVCLERLEKLKDSVKGNGFKEREIKSSIEEIMEKISNTIEEQSFKLERQIPYEKNMEILRDHDADGLSTREEIEKGLDPFSIDSDRDGINDKENLYLTEVEKQKKIEEERSNSLF